MGPPLFTCGSARLVPWHRAWGIIVFCIAVWSCRCRSSSPHLCRQPMRRRRSLASRFHPPRRLPTPGNRGRNWTCSARPPRLQRRRPPSLLRSKRPLRRRPRPIRRRCKGLHPHAPRRHPARRRLPRQKKRRRMRPCLPAPRSPLPRLARQRHRPLQCRSRRQRPKSLRQKQRQKRPAQPRPRPCHGHGSSVARRRCLRWLLRSCAHAVARHLLGTKRLPRRSRHHALPPRPHPRPPLFQSRRQSRNPRPSSHPTAHGSPWTWS